jgi:hypothetical protein
MPIIIMVKTLKPNFTLHDMDCQPVFISSAMVGLSITSYHILFIAIVVVAVATVSANVFEVCSESGRIFLSLIGCHLYLARGYLDI